MVTKEYCDRCNREMLPSSWSGNFTIYEKGVVNTDFDLCLECAVGIRKLIKQRRKK